MNYQECRAYIDDSAKYGSVLGLDNMREMLDRLGNPQDAVPYVHVAGTNGKGSVIAYLYTTLTRAGYKVGRYISPTLYSYRERLEIAGEKISQEDFAKYVTEISRSIDQMTAVGMNHPTPFEIETAAAFLYFKEENCDLVLLETGMGGNLDATNIVKNTKLAVLVSISMDHMSFLGNTLGEIAEKKAGIIKPGCRVVTTKQKPEAAQVIADTCNKLHVPCVVSDSDEAVLEKESVFGQTFSYKGEKFAISLAGVYQKENAVLALNALEELDRLGWTTTMEQRKDGLLHTSWKGRFTVINKKPLFIVDGAAHDDSDEITKYEVSLRQDDDVKELKAKVQKQYEDAQTADPALAAFLDGLGEDVTGSAETADGTTLVVTEDCNVRAAASSDAEVIGGLSAGTEVVKKGESGDWIQIDYEGSEAYVHSSLLEEKTE